MHCIELSFIATTKYIQSGSELTETGKSSHMKNRVASKTGITYSK